VHDQGGHAVGDDDQGDDDLQPPLWSDGAQCLPKDGYGPLHVDGPRSLGPRDVSSLVLRRQGFTRPETWKQRWWTGRGPSVPLTPTEAGRWERHERLNAFAVSARKPLWKKEVFIIAEPLIFDRVWAEARQHVASESKPSIRRQDHFRQY
jgi:hypothetical protein